VPAIVGIASITSGGDIHWPSALRAFTATDRPV